MGALGEAAAAFRPASLVRSTLGGYDRRLVAMLSLSFAGAGAVAYAQLGAIASAGHTLRSLRPPDAKAKAKAQAKAQAEKKAGSPATTGAAQGSSSSSPGVDGVFVRRLVYVLGIVVPGWRSKEALTLAAQACVLVARSLLTLRISRIGGQGLRAVIEQSWAGFFVCLSDFFVTGVAGSVVNSALKYLTNSMTVQWRENLTRHVHELYLRDARFYRSAVLGLGALDHADQRICSDVSEFCSTAADLFGRTFKPALDVVLSTYRMGQHMGYTGLGVLYAYFFVSGGLVRALSPNFPRWIAEGQKREGEFRAAHARLIANAEEVAFLGGADREREILDTRLQGVTLFERYYNLLQFRQGCVDQYLLKYFASMVGWPVLAVPFLVRGGSAADIASAYRESDSLIQNASASVGDLLMVYKKLQRLSGFTARVSELLESMRDGDGDGGRGRGSAATTESWGEDRIRFEGVGIKSPDGRVLVEGLDLEITPGTHVLVTGPNGCGKTSLFRVLAGLWSAETGRVIAPVGALARGACKVLFYVPQRPYLVSGSLRDQVTYPLHLRSPFRAEEDALIEGCLAAVGLLKKLPDLGASYPDWANVLSGGEKQRMGFARLLYHGPKFAILDEATSAINPDEEGALYEAVQRRGITVFSIAHRLELRRFHALHLHFQGDNSGRWTLDRIAH